METQTKTVQRGVQKGTATSPSRYARRTHARDGTALFVTRDVRWRAWDAWGHRLDCWADSKGATDNWLGCGENYCACGIWTCLIASIVALVVGCATLLPNLQRLAAPPDPGVPFLASANCSWNASLYSFAPVCTQTCRCARCDVGVDPLCSTTAPAARCCRGDTNSNTGPVPCCGETCQTCTAIVPTLVTVPCSCPDSVGDASQASDLSQQQQLPPVCTACTPDASGTNCDSCQIQRQLLETWSCNCSCIATPPTQLCSTACTYSYAVAATFVARNASYCHDFDVALAGDLVATDSAALVCGHTTGGAAACWSSFSHTLLTALAPLTVVENATAATASLTGRCWWSNGTDDAKSLATAAVGGLVQWDESPPLPPAPPVLNLAAQVSTALFGALAALGLAITMVTFCCCVLEPERRTMRLPIMGVRAVWRSGLPVSCQDIILDFAYGERKLAPGASPCSASTHDVVRITFDPSANLPNFHG